jgi:hypothetical protein
LLKEIVEDPFSQLLLSAILAVAAWGMILVWHRKTK